MKSRLSSATSLCAALLSLCALPAAAVPVMRTVVVPPYQIGTGASVRLGHIVSASTVYNRLIAGGTYSASCVHPLMSAASGQRSFSGENAVGGVSLTVTIPEYQPATVNMPGFYSLNRGETVNCTYNWTSRAVESGFTIGAFGISFQTGNGEQLDGSFATFTMSVPGTTGSGDYNKCIP